MNVRNVKVRIFPRHVRFNSDRWYCIVSRKTLLLRKMYAWHWNYQMSLYYWQLSKIYPWYIVPANCARTRKKGTSLLLDLAQWLTSFWSCNHDVRQSKVRTTCENLVHSPGESWESHWSCSLSRDPLECILHLRSTLPLCFATILPVSSGTFLPESRGT